MRQALTRVVRRLLRPVVRFLLVLVVAGVALAELDLVRGVLDASSTGERVVLSAIAVGVLVLAAPIIQAARPPRR